MSTNELTSKVKDLRELQQLIEDAQAEAETIKDQIKLFMGDAEELRAGEFKVTYKAVTTSRLDAAALKAQLPEIVKAYTHTSTIRRFNVA